MFCFVGLFFGFFFWLLFVCFGFFLELFWLGLFFFLFGPSGEPAGPPRTRDLGVAELTQEKDIKIHQLRLLQRQDPHQKSSGFPAFLLPPQETKEGQSPSLPFGHAAKGWGSKVQSIFSCLSFPFRRNAYSRVFSPEICLQNRDTLSGSFWCSRNLFFCDKCCFSVRFQQSVTVACDCSPEAYPVNWLLGSCFRYSLC